MASGKQGEIRAIMAELSVIIPARNEIFLQKTIENILENIEADTEIIAVCDGYWPDPPVRDHERVNIIHFTKPVGQRAATNAGARLSQAKYVMKCDAHCAFDKGFDRKLIADCQPDWTMVPNVQSSCFRLDVQELRIQVISGTETQSMLSMQSGIRARDGDCVAATESAAYHRLEIRQRYALPILEGLQKQARGTGENYRYDEFHRCVLVYVQGSLLGT